MALADEITMILKKKLPDPVGSRINFDDEADVF